MCKRRSCDSKRGCAWVSDDKIWNLRLTRRSWREGRADQESNLSVMVGIVVRGCSLDLDSHPRLRLWEWLSWLLNVSLTLTRHSWREGRADQESNPSVIVGLVVRGCSLDLDSHPRLRLWEWRYCSFAYGSDEVVCSMWAKCVSVVLVTRRRGKRKAQS